MFVVFLLACTELEPVVPGVDAPTSPNTLAPATTPDQADLDALIDDMSDRMCDTLATCDDPVYQDMYDANCLGGPSGIEPACDTPDQDKLAACIEGAWSCDGGLSLPDVCNEICPTEDPPTPSDACGIVGDLVGWQGGPLFYRSPLRFQLTQADASATVGLTVNGSPQPVSLHWEDTVLVATPAPLPPNASVEIEVTSCGGTESFSLSTTTSEHGAPLMASPNGAYRIDLSEGQIVNPPGLGAWLDLDAVVWLGVENLDPTTLQLALSSSNAAGTAPECGGLETTGLADFDESPFFSWEEESTVSLPLGTWPGLGIADLQLSGAFDPSATEVGGLTLTGRTHLLDLVPEAEDTTCADLFGPFGVDCAPCGDGTNECIELEIGNLRADYQWWVDDLEEDFEDSDC